MASEIEWTGETWNPAVGCSRVSEGCRNCYAERLAPRLEKNPNIDHYDGTVRYHDGGHSWSGQVNEVPHKLGDPLRWRKPRRVFVNSMSDLFHPDLSFEYVAAVFGVMATTPRHRYQILTKRPERALEFFEWVIQPELARSADGGTPASWCLIQAVRNVKRQQRGDLEDALHPGVGDKPGWPLPNVLIGVSVENQQTAEERLPTLAEIPAAARFVSFEPLLGPVPLRPDPTCPHIDGDDGTCSHRDALTPECHVGADCPLFNPRESLEYLDWIIAGGESGPGARPCHPDWIRGLRDRARMAGIPFFFKQWGRWKPAELDEWHGQFRVPFYKAEAVSTSTKIAGYPVNDVGKGEAGAVLGDREWRQFPPILEIGDVDG